MALSNLFKEPRREITETLVGLFLLIPVFWVTHQISRAMLADLPHTPTFIDLLLTHLLGGFFTMAGTAALVAAAFGVHALGEQVCNWLDEHGLRLRSKERRQ